MAYPKPLSEKSLEKMYREAGLSEKDRDALHRLFSACAHLYGVIDLRTVWEICRKSKTVPRFRLKALLAFSAIVRREAQPYYVLEIEELYSGEPHNELDRHIVHRDLVGYGYGKFEWVYELEDRRQNRPFFVPDDLLSFADPVPGPEETALGTFLSGLRSTAAECVPKQGKGIPNEHRGKRLCEYSFLNAMERYAAEWFTKRPGERALFMEETGGTEAEKILRLIKRAEALGRPGPSELIRETLDELAETGVEVRTEDMEELGKLIMNFHNHSRHWFLCGWKPVELAQRTAFSGPPAVSFGPGIRKAFADGSMDREELVRKLREMGIIVQD